MIENSKIVVKNEDCTKCQVCGSVCPYELFFIENDTLQLQSQFEEECIECGHCSAICPVDIIRLKAHQNEILKDIPKKEDLPSYSSLLNLVTIRRSIRNFKNHAVPKEELIKLLELAKYTATGHNEENIYYTIVQDTELLEKFSNEITTNIRNLVGKLEDSEGRASLEAVLPPETMKKAIEFLPGFKRNIDRVERGRDPWHRGGILLIMHSPKTTTALIENCSLAACNIMLAAESLGIGTCSLGYTTAMLNQFRTVSKLVKIPRNHKVGYTLTLGYPVHKYKRIPARKPLSVKWL